jgi:hypothetical protein
MNKLSSLICSLFCLTFCFGCHSNSTDLPVINVLGQYSEKKIILQDIADIEYIALESSSDVLLIFPNIIYLSDKYIVATNRIRGEVFTFSRDGKIVSRFNRKGRGPQEYVTIHSITFDERAEEFYISDPSSSESRIQVYSKEGDYLRSLKFTEYIKLQIYNYDDQTLFAYDESGLLDDKYRKNPYLYISKRDGKILSELDISLSVRHSDTKVLEVTAPDGKIGKQPFALWVINNRSDGDNFIIADMSADTIYQLTPKKRLIPLITRTPSVQDSDPRIVLTPELKTDKFIVLRKTTLDFNMAQNKGTYPLENLAYDFTTHQIYQPDFINGDFESMGIEFSVTTLPQNTGLYSIDAVTLVTANERGRLTGKLKEITSTLSEDGNPVLVYVKFK